MRIHVIPVGKDPIDRICAPALYYKADKIYLLTMKGVDHYKENFETAKSRFIEQGIIPKNLIEEREDLYDFRALMRLFARICREEQIKHNQLFFNVSTGGKHVAHAAMMACLFFKATPYYCKMEYPSEQVPYPPVLLYYPRYPIELPSKDLIRFLAPLWRFVSDRNRDWASKTECLKFVPAEEEVKTSTKFKKLHYKYFDKLVKLGLVTVEPHPRGRVTFTSEGDLAAEIFAEYYGIENKI